jgi:sulfur-oxidizing protein SoxZ
MMSTTSAKIRAKEKDGEVTIKVLMTHPMETGLRKDKETGKVFPADFIETIVCESAGKPLVTCNWSGTVSKNPYLSIKFEGKKGNDFKFTWTDNSGQSGSETVVIK